MLLEAIRNLLVDDPHGWTEKADPEESVGRWYYHDKTKTVIVFYLSGNIAVNHRRLGPIGRWRLRRALDARVAKIIMDHLLDQVLLDTSRKELT